jgi:hypothetical protein
MRKLTFFICIILLSSCAEKEELPPGVLPLDKMKLVIWDMSLADNMASEKYVVDRDSQRMMATGLYQKVFNLHKVDKATFYKSYAYYEARPLMLQTLFDSVSAYGTRQKAKSFQKSVGIK